MIHPTVEELLRGMAASLREVVVPELPAGPARRQLQAAIAVLRRLAQVWDQTGPYLYADNKDIEQTLGRLLPALERAAVRYQAELKAVCDGLRACLARPLDDPGECASMRALGARNAELQQCLVEVQQALDDARWPERGEVEAALRSLLRRMLVRELAITQPARPK